MVVGLCCLGPMAASMTWLEHMVEEACLPHANQEGERGWGEGGTLVPKSPSKAYLQ